MILYGKGHYLAKYVVSVWLLPVDLSDRSQAAIFRRGVPGIMRFILKGSCGSCALGPAWFT